MEAVGPDVEARAVELLPDGDGIAAGVERDLGSSRIARVGPDHLGRAPSAAAGAQEVGPDVQDIALGIDLHPNSHSIAAGVKRDLGLARRTLFYLNQFRRAPT